MLTGIDNDNNNHSSSNIESIISTSLHSRHQSSNLDLTNSNSYPTSPLKPTSTPPSPVKSIHKDNLVVASSTATLYDPSIIDNHNNNSSLNESNMHRGFNSFTSPTGSNLDLPSSSSSILGLEADNTYHPHEKPTGHSKSLLSTLGMDFNGSNGHGLPLLPTATTSPTTSSKYHNSSWDSYTARLRSSITAIRAPESMRFIIWCTLWYASSAATNNVSKQIMNSYKYPVTLTYVQFGFVALFCYIFGQGMGYTKIQRPARPVLKQMMILSLFQIAGHVFSSVALTMVTVSFAHTIKALSPLFTVVIYRIVYGIPYSTKVYASLFPLTLGVMLVCWSTGLQFNMVGFLCAMTATVVFVLQNIMSKKVFVANSHPHSHLKTSSLNGSDSSSYLPLSKSDSDIGENKYNHGSKSTSPLANASSHHPHQKLDKINLLFFTGLFAGIFMTPLWLYSEGYLFFTDPSTTLPTQNTTLLFILNGITHFLQNFFAFSVLALVSPVTYSVASLVKRIVVIVASIMYFGELVSSRQFMGLLLTFWGLWIYQKAKMDVDKGERKWEAQVEREAEVAEVLAEYRGNTGNGKLEMVMVRN